MCFILSFKKEVSWQQMIPWLMVLQFLPRSSRLIPRNVHTPMLPDVLMLCLKNALIRSKRSDRATSGHFLSCLYLLSLYISSVGLSARPIINHSSICFIYRIFALQMLLWLFNTVTGPNRSFMRAKTEELSKKLYAKIIRSSYLPLLRGSPCERGVTLAHSALTKCPHPYSVVVPYWLLHGSPTLNQEGYFSIEEKYHSVSFLSSEARIYSACYCK